MSARREGFDIDGAEKHGEFFGQVRGYFTEVLFNGIVIYTMQISYPSRLRIGELTSTEGTPQVIEAYCTINGENLTACHVNDRVEGHVIIQATGGYLEGNVTIRVRKDVVLWPDLDYETSTFDVFLKNGEADSISIVFYPDEASSSTLRGYFIQVDFNKVKAWTMESSYPPRLLVES